ncbi:hypothetical protein LXL04_020873 [Taraxacum kok-saghyz]
MTTRTKRKRGNSPESEILSRSLSSAKFRQSHPKESGENVIIQNRDSFTGGKSPNPGKNTLVIDSNPSTSGAHPNNPFNHSIGEPTDQVSPNNGEPMGGKGAQSTVKKLDSPKMDPSIFNTLSVTTVNFQF